MATKANSMKKTSLQWTLLMDGILLDALIDQVIKGNRVNGQFTTGAYVEIVAEVRSKTQNEDIDRDKIKNRMKTLKNIFGETYDAFKGFSGFAWNPVTKTFEVENEVWDALIQANPKAIQWKTKPIHNYNKMLELWVEDRAKGETADTPRERVKKWSNSNATIEDIDDMIKNNEASIDGYEYSFPSSFEQPTLEETSDIQAPSGVRDDIAGSSSKTKAKDGGKKRKNEAVVTQMESVMQKVVDAMERASSIIEKSRPRVYSGDEVYAELATMELEDEVLMEACEYLNENQNKFRVMVSLPVHLRRAWLMKKIRPEDN